LVAVSKRETRGIRRFLSAFWANSPKGSEMNRILRLREELMRFDKIDLTRLQMKSFTDLPLMNYAFFPGGNGLYKGVDAKTFPKIRTVILGSDFACSANYVDGQGRRIHSSGDERCGPTWTPMLNTLRQTPILPEECFFTNVWPVLHLPSKDGKKSNDNPPIDLWRRDDRFTRMCIDFFLFTVDIIQPKLIVALGKGPALFLGDTWPAQLKDWRFSSTSSIDKIRWVDLDRTLIADVSNKDGQFVNTAVNHPSKSRLNAKLRARQYRHPEGEVRLLTEAANRAGIR
jgi:hypothetical protein